MHRLTIVVLVTLAFAACKDSSVGPPPKKLDGDQSLRVAGHLLKQKPVAMMPIIATLGGGKLRLLGTDVRPNPAARGQPLKVTHYFECLGTVDKSWKMFVHGQSAQGGGVVINGDHIPVEGLYPTERWQVGQIIEDTYTVNVPADMSELLLYIGFYRFDDRLPVDDPAMHDGANRILAARVAVGGDQPTLPSYRAPRLKGPIVIDGDLNDAAWKDVPSTGAFVRTGDGQTPKFRTEAKVAWDDTALYVSFDSQDDDVWAKLDKNDDPIYGEEVVEIFVDADGDGKTYNEMQVSPKNVTFDAYFPARRTGMDLAWSSGMTTAVKVRGTLNNPDDKDDGWSAELKIPVANLAAVPHWPPLPTDKWRFNLYRLEWHTNRTNNEGSAFSPPLVGDFHHLPRFGILEFSGQ